MRVPGGRRPTQSTLPPVPEPRNNGSLGGTGLVEILILTTHSGAQFYRKFGFFFPHQTSSQLIVVQILNNNVYLVLGKPLDLSYKGAEEVDEGSLCHFNC